LKETTAFPGGRGLLNRCSGREVGPTLTLFKGLFTRREGYPSRRAKDIPDLQAKFHR